MNRRRLLQALAALAAGEPLIANCAAAFHAPNRGFEIEAGQGLVMDHPSFSQVRAAILSIDPDEDAPFVVVGDLENWGFIQCNHVENGLYVLEVRLPPPDGDWTKGPFVRAELPTDKQEHADDKELVGSDRVLAAFHAFLVNPGRIRDLEGVVWRDIVEELWGDGSDEEA